MPAGAVEAAEDDGIGEDQGVAREQRAEADGERVDVIVDDDAHAPLRRERHDGAPQPRGDLQRHRPGRGQLRAAQVDEHRVEPAAVDVPRDRAGVGGATVSWPGSRGAGRRRRQQRGDRQRRDRKQRPCRAQPRPAEEHADQDDGRAPTTTQPKPNTVAAAPIAARTTTPRTPRMPSPERPPRRRRRRPFLAPPGPG